MLEPGPLLLQNSFLLPWNRRSIVRQTHKCLRNAAVQQGHQLAQDVGSPWRLQSGDCLFWLLFQLNGGWNMLQRIHGSWFFRYPEYLPKHTTAHIYLARLFVPCPTGHGQDMQPAVGIWKHAWVLRLRWSLWGHVRVKRCDWGALAPWQVPAALFHVRQPSSPWLTVSSATHKDFLNPSFYGWRRWPELSLTIIHAQLPL